MIAVRVVKLLQRSALGAALAAGALTVACSGGKDELNADAGQALGFRPGSPASERSAMNNLIGRWYPEPEIRRLSDPTLTPEQWCERPVSRINVTFDQVEVQCDTGPAWVASVSQVRTTTKAGEVLLLFRARKESGFTSLRFSDNAGSKLNIGGSPCFRGASTPHARFPDYEILTRQILGGKRCSQLNPATTQ